jgi:hypothetical protein
MLKSFGSDPEFMIKDIDGNYVSAIGVVPGHKKDKVNLGNGHYAFYDNVLVEVNIRPSFSRDEAIKNFQDCFKRLARLVGDLRLVPQASQMYPLSECQHPDALVFGCDPEFSLYKTDFRGRFVRLQPPTCSPGNPFRSGGGHVHVGSDLALPYGSGKPVQCLRMLDLFLGATSVLIDHDPTSKARRKLYGGAGTHRFKVEYGVEYRAMSNFWLASPDLVALIYDLTNLAIKLVDCGKADQVWGKINPDELRDSINSADRETIISNIFPVLSAEMNMDLLNRVKKMFAPYSFNFYKEWGLNAG